MLLYAMRQPMVALRLDSVTTACPPPSTQPFAPPPSPSAPPPQMKKSGYATEPMQCEIRWMVCLRYILGWIILMTILGFACRKLG